MSTWKCVLLLLQNGVNKRYLCQNQEDQKGLLDPEIQNWIILSKFWLNLLTDFLIFNEFVDFLGDFFIFLKLFFILRIFCCCWHQRTSDSSFRFLVSEISQSRVFVTCRGLKELRILVVGWNYFFQINLNDFFQIIKTHLVTQSIPAKAMKRKTQRQGAPIIRMSLSLKPKLSSIVQNNILQFCEQIDSSMQNSILKITYNCRTTFVLKPK